MSFEVTEGMTLPDLITSVRQADVYGLFKAFVYSTAPALARQWLRIPR